MGKGHSTSPVMELVAQSGSPDLQLGSCSAWPPQTSPKCWTFVRAPAVSQRPTGRRGMSDSSLVGSAWRASNLGGFSKGGFSNPDSVPGSTQGFYRPVVADLTSHSAWRQAAQFNPEKMETEVL